MQEAERHVVVPALQEAERQAGLDTILAALAQKGAQEAALANELAALRGQEQVGTAGTTGQPPPLHSSHVRLPLAGSVHGLL